MGRGAASISIPLAAVATPAAGAPHFARADGGRWGCSPPGARRRPFRYPERTHQAALMEASGKPQGRALAAKEVRHALGARNCSPFEAALRGVLPCRANVSGRRDSRERPAPLSFVHLPAVAPLPDGPNCRANAALLFPRPFPTRACKQVRDRGAVSSHEGRLRRPATWRRSIPTCRKFIPRMRFS